MDDREEDYVIPFSRGKLVSWIRLFVIGIPFILLGHFATIGDSRISALLVRCTAIPTAAVLTVMLLHYWGKLRGSAPAIILNSRGISENGSLFPVSLVRWRDIVAIHVRSYLATQWLEIEVEDPKKYLARGHALARIFRSSLELFGGSPIFVSAEATDLPFEDLVRKVRKYVEEYGSA